MVSAELVHGQTWKKQDSLFDLVAPVKISYPVDNV